MVRQERAKSTAEMERVSELEDELLQTEEVERSEDGQSESTEAASNQSQTLFEDEEMEE